MRCACMHACSPRLAPQREGVHVCLGVLQPPAQASVELHSAILALSKVVELPSGGAKLEGEHRLAPPRVGDESGGAAAEASDGELVWRR